MAHELHFVRLIGAVADLTALLKDQGVRGAFIGGLAANLFGRCLMCRQAQFSMMKNTGGGNRLLMVESNGGHRTMKGVSGCHQRGSARW